MTAPSRSKYAHGRELFFTLLAFLGQEAAEEGSTFST